MCIGIPGFNPVPGSGICHFGSGKCTGAQKYGPDATMNGPGEIHPPWNNHTTNISAMPQSCSYLISRGSRYGALFRDQYAPEPTSEKDRREPRPPE